MSLRLGGYPIQPIPIGASPMDTSWQDATGLYKTSATQQHALGRRAEDIYGNVYHYAKNAAVALVAGNVLQQAALGGATTTEQDDLVIATGSAVGDKFAYATIDTTEQAVNLFAEGWYIVSDGGAAHGQGHMYRIKDHLIGSVASVKFNLYDPIRATITAGTSEAHLIVHPYKNVIQAPITTPTGAAVGVAPMVVPASHYFWMQTWGVANCLAVGTMTAGASVVRATAVAGGVAIQVSTANLITEVVGYSLAAITDTDNGPIFLTIMR